MFLAAERGECSMQAHADHEQLAARLDAIARAHLDFGLPQVRLSYELIVEELDPMTAEANESFIRSTIAHWNRHIIHFIPKNGDSQGLCGWRRGTPRPILDGIPSSLTPYYHCNQHEACPDCWRLTH
jgi:hypothetical protein